MSDRDRRQALAGRHGLSAKEIQVDKCERAPLSGAHFFAWGLSRSGARRAW